MSGADRIHAEVCEHLEKAQADPGGRARLPLELVDRPVQHHFYAVAEYPEPAIVFVGRGWRSGVGLRIADRLRAIGAFDCEIVVGAFADRLPGLKGVVLAAGEIEFA